MTLPFDPRFRADATQVVPGGRRQSLLGDLGATVQNVGRVGAAVGHGGAQLAKALYHEPRATTKVLAEEGSGYASAKRLLGGTSDGMDKVALASMLLPGVGLLRGAGKAAAAESWAAKTLAMLPDIEKAGGATLTQAGEHFAGGKQFSVGMGTKVKPTKALTHEALVKAFNEAGDGHNVGIWKDKGRWYVEPSRPFDNLDEATQVAVDRGEKAIYDHGAGESMILLRHHSPVKGVSKLSPKFAGSGPVRGVERGRAGAVPGVHFYRPESLSEPGIGNLANTYFSPVHESKIVNLGMPRDQWPQHVQELLKGMKGTNDMELRLKKAGIMFENVSPANAKKRDALRIVKGFGEYPTYTKGGKIRKAKAAPAAPAAAAPVEASPLAQQVYAEAPSRPVRPPPDESLAFPDTPAADARAGLLGDPLPPNSVHQAPQASLLRQRASTAPARAREAGLERATGRALQNDKFDQSIQLGQEMGADRWYDTDRLMQKWIDELGPVEGPKAYRQFAQSVGATSPGAPVADNIRRASHEYSLARQGKLESSLAEGHRDIPKGYAAIYQPTNNAVLRGLLKTGEITTPKAASFVENLTGNAAPATIDRHFVRAMNETLPPTSKFKVKGEAPSGLEYGALERAFKLEAERRGMTPAELQASWWVGMGNETGMLSGSASFEDHVAHRVIETAKALGKDTPQGHKEVMKLFVKGQIPLLGIGGAAVLAQPKEQGLLR